MTRAPLLAAASALAVILAGCGGSTGSTGSSSGNGSIVLYNGQHLQLTTALVSAFEKKTGVSVRVRTNDSLVLADQILQEGQGSPADVYLSENSPELMHLEQHGLLSKIDSSTLGQVPSSVSSPTGKWVGVALRVSALVYDPKRITRSELPASILDLSHPKWKGKVAVAPVDSDFPPVVGAVIGAYGLKTASSWLQGLKRNAHTYQDDESVVAAVNRGDETMGIINQYYWYRLRLEVGKSGMRSALYYFPRRNVGSITNISGAAVLASSAHQDDAQKFVAFLVSRAGQRLIASGDDFEYPARPSVKPNVALPPLASISHATLGPAKIGTDAPAAKLLEQIGLL